jgi:hypothetical protein
MARPDGHAIDQHRASPALAFAAPEFGPCEAEIVAQHIQEGLFPVRPQGMPNAVNVDFRDNRHEWRSAGR